MGLELAEIRLLEALRTDPQEVSLDVRVVGRRQALRHARSVRGRWVPARPHSLPRRALAGADLVHLLGLDVPPPHRTPFVATIHDLSPLHFDDEVPFPPWLDEVIGGARLLLTPSRFTAGELMKHFGVEAPRIRVFGGAPALDAGDAKPLSEADLADLGISSPFVLRYGGYTTRKNVPLLLEAWAAVPHGTLVLAGPPQRPRERILREAPSLERVIVLDYISSGLLARLLRTATALISTSTYEGFGLPPLEALAVGTPVVAVSQPFVRETCGDAAVLVRATPADLAEAVSSLLDPTRRAQALRSGVRQWKGQADWRTAAALVLETYKLALQRASGDASSEERRPA